MSSASRQAKFKKASAHARKGGKSDGTGADANSGTAAPEDSNASGAADAEAKPTGYVLFDGREDVLAYWQGELSREEKFDILTVNEAELSQELASQLDGEFVIEEKKVHELYTNAELMTAARLAFVDGVYAKGGAVKPLQPDDAAPDAAVNFLVHTILGLFERHTLLSWERQNFFLRTGCLLLYWVWSWSDWDWFIRYPIQFFFCFLAVACANAATTFLSPAEQTTPTQSKFWQSVAKGFLQVKYYLIYPFDDESNPILLRSRVEIFLSALLLLDVARWVSMKKYILLIIITVILPYGILQIEKGGGGRNKSAQALYKHTSSRSADKNGLRYLRLLLIAVSNCLTIYFTWSKWMDAIILSFFFFPNLTTIILSTTSIAIAGFFLAFAKFQEQILGDLGKAARSKVYMYWLVWGVLVYAKFFSNIANENGWIVWLACYSGLLLFTPPFVSHVFQICGGGVCALLLSVGVHTVCKVALEIGRLVLTKEGMTEIAKLIKASVVYLWRYLIDFILNGTTAQPGSADSSSSASGFDPSSAEASTASSSSSTESSTTGGAHEDASSHMD